jgi:hypothetical protein
MSQVEKTDLTPMKFIARTGLKAITTAGIYTGVHIYFNKNKITDPLTIRAFLSSFASSALAEVLSSSILSRLLALSANNLGVKRIFDQGLTAAISGGIQIKAYEMLVLKAPGLEGQFWTNHEEFLIQVIADAVAELLTNYYWKPLFKLDESDAVNAVGV